MWKLIAISTSLLILAAWLLYSEDKLDTIKGKRVLITGASTGIGKQLAYHFAKLGASIVVTARRQNVLEQVAEECKNLAPSSSDAKYLAISADMLNSESISNLIDKSVNQLGGLDIVVLNHVGKYSVSLFDGGKEMRDYVHSTIDVNFKSYVEVTGLVMSHLTKTNGSLVVVNALMGHIPNPKMAAYTASKFALNGFFDSLRSQFIMEERNISVTSCVLGAIDTYNAQQIYKDAKLKRIMQMVVPASADDTALAIVGASARRDDVMYYPASMLMNVILYKFFPWLFDFGMREIYRY